ncbi:MAG TPA: serine/threonine-protein kinase [Ktedonobacterales bacterium]
MADVFGDRNNLYPDQPRRDQRPQSPYNAQDPFGGDGWHGDPRTGGGAVPPTQAPLPTGRYVTDNPQSPPVYGERDTTQIDSPKRFHLKPGTVLQNGRYIVESVIGHGGMGHVYRVEDTHLNTQRALKEMIPRLGDPEAELTNYKREAQMLLHQEHPGIPQIYDWFIEYHRAYIVLHYIPGENLEERLTATSGYLTQEQVGQWMLQLCQIVSHLHAQRPPIIFRDIKPNNIILTPDGRIVLVDFGIAKTFVEDKEHTSVGTNGYAPPEQYRGQAEPRSDIYAIGATMHHLLTRSDPRKEPPFTFSERPPRALNPAISEELAAIIMRCVQSKVDDRYSSCDELALAIEGALGLGPTSDTGQYRAARIGGRGPRPTWSPPSGPTSSLLSPVTAQWAFETEEQIRGTPYVGPDLVYVGSYDNNLYALDKRTGALRWKFPTEGGVCSRPVLWRNLIVFGSEDFNVYALDALTGAEVWRYRTWHHVRSSPRVFQDIVYIGSDDGYMHAIDPSTGRMVWRFQTYREVQSSAAFADGLVMFGSRDHYFYGVDALTGEKKWGYRTQGPVISAPCVVDGQVYFGSYDFSVYCLEAKSGWRAWEERTEKFIISSPTISGDRLYIGSTDSHLYCLNRNTGKRIWRYKAGNQVNSTPTVAAGQVIFGSIDRNIYALDAQEGKLRWRFETDDIVPGSPVVSDAIVYVGSADHMLYALRPGGAGAQL